MGLNSIEIEVGLTWSQVLIFMDIGGGNVVVWDDCRAGVEVKNIKRF